MTASTDRRELASRLLDRLNRLARDAPPPCTFDPDLWHAEERADRTYAAQLCRRCPLLGLCSEYADTARERAGVWGGRDREPIPRPRVKENAAA